MSKEWKIVKTLGPSKGADLIGCRLVQTEFGFEFEKPDKSKLSSKSGLMPTLPFDFSQFDYKGSYWTITVEATETGKDDKEAVGRWKTSKAGTPADEDGTWVAQAGGKGEEIDGEATAASA